MNKRIFFCIFSIVTFTVFFLFSACNLRDSYSQKTTITIAAASSLESVLTQHILPMFIAKNPRITPEGVYHGSGWLQIQIEAGLNADVFFPASMTQMDNLLRQGLIKEETIVPLLENRLVLIKPKGVFSEVTGFYNAHLARSAALPDPQSVPAGKYAKEVFDSLGNWDIVSAGASFGTNVTQVLHWVAEANAEIGVVYITDAALSERVKIIEEAPPASLLRPIIYPVAILSGSPNKKEAELFISFLLSEEAAAVFEASGFSIHSRH